MPSSWPEIVSCNFMVPILSRVPAGSEKSMSGVAMVVVVEVEEDISLNGVISRHP